MADQGATQSPHPLSNEALSTGFGGQRVPISELMQEPLLPNVEEFQDSTSDRYSLLRSVTTKESLMALLSSTDGDATFDEISSLWRQSAAQAHQLAARTMAAPSNMVQESGPSNAVLSSVKRKKLRKFHVFEPLPLELRLKIFEHAFPELATGRVVNLVYDNFNNRYYSPNYTLPILLHISQAYRHQALERFRLCFGTESCEARFYFDFHKDILLFDDYLHLSYIVEKTLRDTEDTEAAPDYHEWPFSSEEQNGIERVALNWQFLNANEQPLFTPLPQNILNQLPLELLTVEVEQGLWPRFIRRFRALRDLIFVVEDFDPYYRGKIKLIAFGEILECQACKPLAKFSDLLTSAKRIVDDLCLEDCKSKVSLKTVGACRDGGISDVRSCLIEHIEEDDEDIDGDSDHGEESDDDEDGEEEDLGSMDPWLNPEDITQEEVDHLVEDERAFQALIPPNERSSRYSYRAYQGDYIDPEYLAWRKENWEKDVLVRNGDAS